MSHSITIIDETELPRLSFPKQSDGRESNQGNISWASFPAGNNLVMGVAFVEPGNHLTPHIHSQATDSEIYACLSGNLCVPKELNPNNQKPLSSLSYHFIKAGEAALVPPRSIHGLYNEASNTETARLLYMFAGEDFENIKYDYPNSADEDAPTIEILNRGEYTQAWPDKQTPLSVSHLSIPPDGTLILAAESYPKVLSVIEDGNGIISSADETEAILSTLHATIAPRTEIEIHNPSAYKSLELVRTDTFIPQP